MLFNDIQVDLERSRREREIAERARARRLLFRERRSVRRVVGRSMISIGSRLAAEPQPRLARSQ